MNLQIGRSCSVTGRVGTNNGRRGVLQRHRALVGGSELAAGGSRSESETSDAVPEAQAGVEGWLHSNARLDAATREGPAARPTGAYAARSAASGGDLRDRARRQPRSGRCGVAGGSCAGGDPLADRASGRRSGRVVARTSGRSSDVGGLLDFVFDTIGYAVIPLGLAFGIDDRGTWIATAVLLAAFYLNAVSLGYVAALLEKRALGRSQPRVSRRAPCSLGGWWRAPRRSCSSPWRSRSPTRDRDDLVGDGGGRVLITALERVRWAIGVLR